MKKVKMTVMTIMMVLMSISFIACDSDDNNTTGNNGLTGRWYVKTESLSNLLIINGDNSVVAYKVSDYDAWVDIEGNLTVDGNRMSIYFEDGNCLSGTYSVNGNTLIVNTTNGEYRYSRLAEETNLLGDWNYSNINFKAKAIKDEIVIPGGTINGEEVPPTIMQTAQLSGRFIEYAAERYFKNISFDNEGTMAYNVLTDEGEKRLTKNYSIDGLNLTITGETAGHRIESAFMVFQSFDKDSVYFIFDKESVAEMFIGYALMLFEGGIAPDVTDEALEEYKKAFTEAFEYYSVEFVITRA